MSAIPKLSLFVDEKWTTQMAEDETTPLKTYKATAQKIIEEQETPSDTLTFVRQFNTAWTAARIAHRVISAPPKGCRRADSISLI